MTEWLTTEDVASEFRTVPATVRYWRHTGTGPRGTRVGRRVLYARADVDQWVRDQREANPRPVVA
ncbi:helix-turn-helix domain-containing protein [Jatrophihabitans sp. YIM 134969]